MQQSPLQEQQRQVRKLQNVSHQELVCQAQELLSPNDEKKAFMADNLTQLLVTCNTASFVLIGN